MKYLNRVRLFLKLISKGDSNRRSLWENFALRKMFYARMLLRNHADTQPVKRFKR